MISAKNLSKEFNGKKVVEDLSFEVREGEIFGLLGPNGAGKTTTLRLLLDILKPDSGRISSLAKDNVGYLPEERGLYQQVSLLDHLVYFGELKGLDREDAEAKALNLLRKIDLLESREMKVQELSKGNQQMLQFVATLVHDPEVLILDEPFQGLDPLNLKLVKNWIRGLGESGDRTVILSTHQIEEVEELCERILLINKGREVLYGNLSEIKSQQGEEALEVEYEGKLDIEGVQIVNKGEGKAKLYPQQKSSQQILKELVNKVEVKHFSVSRPSLREIFVREMEK